MKSMKRIRLLGLTMALVMALSSLMAFAETINAMLK